jgi:hypothetical protein
VEIIKINIVKDFSETPGARFIKEGDFSGELFFKTILEPKYLEAKEKKMKLQIDLDGTSGFATSFLDESFGNLSRKYGIKDVLEIVELISLEEPSLIEEIINEYISQKYKK